MCAAVSGSAVVMLAPVERDAEPPRFTSGTRSSGNELQGPDVVRLVSSRRSIRGDPR